MKVMTVLGTRPEIIRLSRIIPLLDRFCQHRLINTGQNFDKNLNLLFFKELNIRPADYFLNVRSKSSMEQIGQILHQCAKIFKKEKPDRLLVLGDTNSALSAIAAKRLGITVMHLEAGNRCFDDRVPEEINRRIVDHSSDLWLSYTERSRANLLREGIPGQRIYVTGNPIKEVLDHYEPAIKKSRMLVKLDLTAQKYFLVTLHRTENVDVKSRLKKVLKALNLLQREYQQPIVCSLHPRTGSQIAKLKKIKIADGIRFIEPPGFFDFVNLEKHARCVLTDSGPVQEECCIFRVPNVTLRDVTERPESIERGSSIITGNEPESIIQSVGIVLTQSSNWTIPAEYLETQVSSTVAKIILSVMPA